VHSDTISSTEHVDNVRIGRSIVLLIKLVHLLSLLYVDSTSIGLDVAVSVREDLSRSMEYVIHVLNIHHMMPLLIVVCVTRGITLWARKSNKFLINNLILAVRLLVILHIYTHTRIPLVVRWLIHL
jgi:hypothetical protein